MSFRCGHWCEIRDKFKFSATLSSNKNLQEMFLVTNKQNGNETLNLIQKINFSQVKIMGSIGCEIKSIS